MRIGRDIILLLVRFAALQNEKSKSGHGIRVQKRILFKFQEGTIIRYTLDLSFTTATGLLVYVQQEELISPDPTGSTGSLGTTVNS
jgi:hypothetical protein